MFSSSSNFKNINIISKIIGLLFMLSSIFITNNIYIILTISVLFLILSYKKLFPILTIILLLVEFSFDYNLLFYLKIMLVIDYIFMFFRIINFNELRYFLEDLLYKRHSRLLKKLLYIMYLFKEFRFNYTELVEYMKSYGFSLSMKNYLFILKMSYKKALVNAKNIIINLNYRLYGFNKKRSYIDKDIIDSYDFKYILVYVIIFLVICIVESI